MGGGVWDLSCSLLLANRIFGALAIIYIAGFKGRKMDIFKPDRKNTTIVVFDKPISEKCKTFSQYQDWEYGFLPTTMFGFKI